MTHPTVFHVFMVYAGGHWYISSGFWTPAAGLIVAVVFGILNVWVAWWIAYPKRRLYYEISSDTKPVYTGSITGVEKRHQSEPFDRPSVVTLMFRNAGRRDIARDVFDGTPLQFDVTTRIINCLDIKTRPVGQPKPRVKTDGSVLSVEPVKIGKGATIFVDLLIADPRPELRQPDQTLTDVEIRHEPDHKARVASGLLTSGALSLVGWMLVMMYLSPKDAPAHVNSDFIAWFGGALACIGTVLSFVFFLYDDFLYDDI